MPSFLHFCFENGSHGGYTPTATGTAFGAFLDCAKIHHSVFDTCSDLTFRDVLKLAQDPSEDLRGMSKQQHRRRGLFHLPLLSYSQG
jgi:hypothetical protein